MVFVHMCEVAQVLSDPELGVAALQDILSMEKATYKHAVDQALSTTLLPHRLSLSSLPL